MSRRRTAFARAVDALFTRRRKLTPATTDYSVERGMLVPMRDGAELVADLYTPVGASRGLILVRTAYGRGFPISTEFVRPYAERGFTVLIQSTRGTHGSGGTKVPFHNEIEDGADTVEWMRHQPWFPGRFAFHGLSYLGYNGWAIMMDPPPELATAVISSAPHHFGRMATGPGAAAPEMFLGFSDGYGHQETDSIPRVLWRSSTMKKRHAPVLNALPLAGAEVELLEGRAPWYREWLAHPDPNDDYWADGNFDEALQRVSVPLLIQGGWQDLFLEEAVQEYEALHSRGIPVALTLGPWTHPDAGGIASSRLGNEALAWLAEVLAEEPTADSRLVNPVRIQVGGVDEWRALESWPPPAEDRILLLGAGGALGESPSVASTAFTYDPADPTPNVGGATQMQNPGSKEQGELEARSDVLTFTTGPLAADLEVIGTPRLRLFHDTDNPYADLMVRVCDVHPDGRSFNLAERYVRLDPAAASGELELSLRPMAHRFLAGHRVRVQVSGGAFPRYLRNLGTDAAPGVGVELVPSNRTVWHDVSRPSSISLPITK